MDTGGEVIISENGDYDKLVITKSVIISAAPGVNAGIVSNGGYRVNLAIGIGRRRWEIISRLT